MQTYDQTIEEIILSAALLSRDALTSVATLPEDVFTSTARVEIHAAMRAQFEAGDQASLASMYSALAPDVAAELLDITVRNPTSSGWSVAIDKAISLRTTRRIMSSTMMTQDLLKHHGPEAAIEFVRAELSESWRSFGSAPTSISEMGDDVLKGVPHLPFGIHDLDVELMGIPLQTLVTIGARPSIGKTALALSLLQKWAGQGVACKMFSLEMPRSSLARRLISAESGVDGSALRTGRITEADRLRATTAWEKIKGKLTALHIDDRSRTITKIFAEAHKAVNQHGAKVILVDHIGLIRGMEKKERRDLQIAEYNSRCAEFSKTNDCIWINLCQLVRGAEGEKPKLSDLRESGSIEQDSDIVILLHRDRDNASKVLEVDVAKFRDGKVVDRKIHFDPAIMQIGDFPVYQSRYEDGYRA